MENSVAKILICDYHESYSRELANQLNNHGMVKVLGNTRSLGEAASYLSFTMPDIILVDVHKLLDQQTDKISQIKRKYPCIRLLALELYEEEISNIDLFRKGFDGVVARNSELSAIESEMLLAIRRRNEQNVEHCSPGSLAA